MRSLACFAGTVCVWSARERRVEVCVLTAVALMIETAAHSRQLFGKITIT